jgi:sodium transport system permease protein
LRNIFTVFKKEFYRVVSDRRLIFTAILLPGLAIYIMYSFMGNAISNETDDINNHVIVLYQEHMPDEYYSLLQTSGREFDIHNFDESDYETIHQNILNGDIDVLIRFPEDFVDSVTTDNGVIPNVLTYYNPGERYSENAYYVISSILTEYHDALLYNRFGNDVIVFNTDLGNNDHFIVDENKAVGKGFASLLPMLIIMFLFSGAMSIGPDAIAGEKERGTIATLLVTPIKRSEVAIGKVLGLTVISLMSATSSFLGIMLSLPKIMQNQELDTNIYGVTEYLLILLVLLSTVLLIVGLVSLISAYAKTVKEASMLILPLYFVSVIVGVSTMFSGEATSNWAMYLVPIYNSVNVLIGILTFDVIGLHVLLLVVSNAVYVALLIFSINKLFESERVMFSK